MREKISKPILEKKEEKLSYEILDLTFNYEEANIRKGLP